MNANTQATPRAGKGGVVPPADKQFGKPNGNKQGRGFWKKEDTPRYKLEQMMQLTEDELLEVVKDRSAPYFERKLATAINKGDWKSIESMINQVYGMPKQQVEQTTIDPPAPRLTEGK